MLQSLSPGRFAAAISRRKMLKGTAATVAGVAAASALPKSGRADDVLTLLSWPGYADPAVVEPFEKAHGVKIVGKEYTGGDNMLALLNSSPPVYSLPTILTPCAFSNGSTTAGSA